MSIIRSNIARQLLAEGGAPRASFRNGGKGRTDANTMSGSGYGAGSSSTDYSSFGPDQEEDNARMMSDMGLTPSVGPDSDDDDKALSYVNFNRPTERPSFFQQGIDAIGAGLQNRRGQNILNFLNRSTAPTVLGKLGLGSRGDINYILEQLQANRGDPVAIGLTDKQFEIGQKLIDAGIKDEFDIRNMTQSQFDNLFPGPTKSEGGDSQPIKRLQAPITEKIEEKPKLSDIENLLRLRGSAFEDGGEVRQDYFGGGITKALKKAAGAVKKVAKSPLGKAALIGGLGFLGTKTKFGADLLTSFKALDPLKQALIIGGGALTAAPFFIGQEEEEDKLDESKRTDPQFTNLINYYGGSRRFAEDGGDIDEAPMKMASNIENDKILEDLFEKYLDMGLSPKDAAEKAKEEFDRMSKKQGIERTMAAMGGMMEQDEMLDLGGNEMDLRGGGFVPIGEYEKKDDVPARLSKNEFVFTADAVRAAGGGSVDKGADLMYKTMKTLENKVA